MAQGHWLKGKNQNEGPGMRAAGHPEEAKSQVSAGTGEHPWLRRKELKCSGQVCDVGLSQHMMHQRPGDATNTGPPQPHVYLQPLLQEGSSMR